MYNDNVEIFKKYSLLWLIVILAAVLRLYNLSGNPPGLTWDEAALGYNSYSLLQTGKDEYGNFLPLILKSFGDYKPALYAYLDIPFIFLFGLNEWAVRLPSAIFGILTVILIYFLVYELFNKVLLAVLASLAFAISPFAIQFSRPAFEANVALFLNTLGIFLFIRGLKNKKLLFLSIVIFALSLLAYQASKMLVPLFLISLILIYKDQLRSKNLFKPVLLAISLIVFLIILMTFWSGQSQRLSTLNFFAYQRSAKEIIQISEEDRLQISSWQFQLLHGEWFSYIRGFIERYLIYFSPKLLFIDGDYNERHSVPDLGVLYYYSCILIPLGIIFFIKQGGKSVYLLFAWLLLAPLPAVLSRDLISTIRALNIVIPLAILEAGGLYFLGIYLKKLKGYFFVLGVIAISLIIITNVIIYLDRYFIHAPFEYSKFWLYGYKQVFSEASIFNKDNLAKYRKIVISDSYGQPYIYYLFYTKYNPADFQKQAILDQPNVDVGTVRRIDNIEFRHIFWPTERGDRNNLFVGSLEELPDQDVLPFTEFQILQDIKFLNGQTAFRVVEIK